MQQRIGGTVLANLLTGLDVDERFTRTESGTTRTHLPDTLGSTMALADTAAAIQTSYAYDPYGVTSASGASSDNPYQFTGRPLYYFAVDDGGTEHELRLQDHRARWLDLLHDRWLQRAPDAPPSRQTVAGDDR